MNQRRREANALKREATERDIRRKITQSGRRQRFMIAAGLAIGGTTGALAAAQANPEDARIYEKISGAFAISAGFISVGEFLMTEKSAMNSVLRYRADTGQTTSFFNRVQVNIGQGQLNKTVTKDPVAAGKTIAKLYPQMMRPMASIMCISSARVAEGLANHHHGETTSTIGIAFYAGLMAVSATVYEKMPAVTEGRIVSFERQLDNIDNPLTITRSEPTI